MVKKIFTLIPIKFNSERVPGKNFRLMNGNPLFYYIIKTLLESKYLGKIIINIDNNLTEISITKYFLEEVNSGKILFYKRPKHLEGGHIPTNLLFIDMIESMSLNADYYFQTHTTNPLLKVETINNAIKQFLDNQESKGYDSLYSVKEWKTRLYDKNSNAINHNPKELLPTQDLEPLYEENSCMYLFSYDSIKRYNHRIGPNPLMYIMNDIESQDIDIETDFKITESIMADMYLNSQKVIVVTGVCGGIGHSTALMFKKSGCKVLGIDIKNNDEVRSSIDELHNVNLKNENEIINFVNYVKEKYGRVDIIVNNAAYQVCKEFHNHSIQEWDDVINVNVRSGFLLCKNFRDLLVENKGNIINVSSVHSIATSENIAVYAASKGCLSALTRAMALEFGKVGVRVNSICPGAVNTSMLRAGLMRDNFGEDISVEEKLKTLGNKQCIGRVGEPEEIAELIFFLADNRKSGYITGENIVIDGGATIKLSTE